MYSLERARLFRTHHCLQVGLGRGFFPFSFSWLLLPLPPLRCFVWLLHVLRVVIFVIVCSYKALTSSAEQSLMSLAASLAVSVGFTFWWYAWLSSAIPCLVFIPFILSPYIWTTSLSARSCDHVSIIFLIWSGIFGLDGGSLGVSKGLTITLVGFFGVLDCSFAVLLFSCDSPLDAMGLPCCFVCVFFNQPCFAFIFMALLDFYSQPLSRANGLSFRIVSVVPGVPCIVWYRIVCAVGAG